MSSEAIMKVLQDHSVIVLTFLVSIVYYVLKYFIMREWSYCGLELFTIFLFYEFTSLKKMLSTHFRHVEWSILYNKIQMDKVYGKPSADDIVKGMQE